jgi:hypothetical protein
MLRKNDRDYSKMYFKIEALRMRRYLKNKIVSRPPANPVIPVKRDNEAMKRVAYKNKSERYRPLYAKWKEKKLLDIRDKLAKMSKGAGRWTIDKLAKLTTKKNMYYIGLAAVSTALTVELIHELTDSKNAIMYIGGRQSQRGDYTDFGSPVDLGKVIQRGNSVMRQLPRHRLNPTMGLPQQLHKQAINHTLQGNAKIQDQFNRLFNFNNNY